MKARDKGGVVDERLNVYGVKGLKIAGEFFFSPSLVQRSFLYAICADCSITPGNVGANTYNTAIAIGEKAAVIIAEDLGIGGVFSA